MVLMDQEVLVAPFDCGGGLVRTFGLLSEQADKCLNKLFKCLSESPKTAIFAGSSQFETSKVERADVFRYLVLWKEGGYYADANVECMKPIDEWGIPNDAQRHIACQKIFQENWAHLVVCWQRLAG